MLIKTAEGWVRMEPAVVVPAPNKVQAQTYWWMGLCPINPKDAE